jgi:hypothetical protein
VKRAVQVVTSLVGRGRILRVDGPVIGQSADSARALIRPER